MIGQDTRKVDIDRKEFERFWYETNLTIKEIAHRMKINHSTAYKRKLKWNLPNSRRRVDTLQSIVSKEDFERTEKHMKSLVTYD